MQALKYKRRREEVEELEELKKKNRVDCGACDATRGVQYEGSATVTFLTR